MRAPAGALVWEYQSDVETNARRYAQSSEPRDGWDTIRGDVRRSRTIHIASKWQDHLRMPRLRTIVIAAVVAVVVTDVTWDGTSLRVSVGWPRRRPIASFVFP